jgi:sec-independent protein translocase protein TatC
VIHIPIKDHINELKYRLLYVIITFIINFILCYYYSEELIYIISRPIDIIYNNNFIYTTITEVFNTYIIIAINISIYITIISLIITIFLFLYSGLYAYEIKNIINYISLSIFLITFSNYIAYKYIIPLTYTYFINLEKTKQTMLYSVLLLAKINEYSVNYLLLLLLITLCSLLPILLLILLKIKIININYLNNKRNYIYIYIILIISMITPPDILSISLLSITMVIIYELIIMIIYLKDIYIFFKRQPN